LPRNGFSPAWLKAGEFGADAEQRCRAGVLGGEIVLVALNLWACPRAMVEQIDMVAVRKQLYSLRLVGRWIGAPTHFHRAYLMLLSIEDEHRCRHGERIIN
jgi:hypothetical protein